MVSLNTSFPQDLGLANDGFVSTAFLRNVALHVVGKDFMYLSFESLASSFLPFSSVNCSFVHVTHQTAVVAEGRSMAGDAGVDRSVSVATNLTSWTSST
jgi:hypothetical protein